ncbi:MAG: HAMP domain-containing histidine kinase [Ruminococcus sp.]|nr:HAMP domain-containing histidine kinase [Ruminococcus sp.]
MEVLCLWIAIILLAVIITLAVKLYLIRCAVREIITGLEKKLSTDTNAIIYLSSGDKGMRRLASELNVQLKALQKERIRCQQGDVELKRDVTNISHDLRTPLTAIVGYLNILEREKMSPQAQQYLKIISERTSAMKLLTEELLKYSVAVSGDNLSLDTEDVIVNNVLEESISGFYAVLTESGISPEISICEEKVHRMLNKNALSRVFSNIISNAVKYSSGDLCITLTEDGTITFSNSASGLDEISVGRLFDRYYTVETGDRSTGIGLSIARELTEQMGGTISAEYIGERVVINIVF